jgi:hypothetical protein
MPLRPMNSSAGAEANAASHHLAVAPKKKGTGRIELRAEKGTLLKNEPDPFAVPSTEANGCSASSKYSFSARRQSGRVAGHGLARRRKNEPAPFFCTWQIGVAAGGSRVLRPQSLHSICVETAPADQAGFQPALAGVGTALVGPGAGTGGCSAGPMAAEGR